MLLCALAAGMLTACVQSDEYAENTPQNGTEVPIVNTPEGAQSGELLIKFRPEVSDLLDKAPITRSAGMCRMTRSGIRTVDELMEIIGGF